MDKYLNKYRINSTRLQNWDYGWPASYFITICTYRRICYFGQIQSAVIHLSETGNIAKNCWLEIPEHFPFLELSDFVIMPNHIHGILSLTNNKSNDDHPVVDVETRHALSLQPSPTMFHQPSPTKNPNVTKKSVSRLTPGQKRFQNQGTNTVSSIIGGYKSAITRKIHQMGFEFQWQADIGTM